MNRISFNILGQYLNNTQWRDCLDYIGLLRPTTIGVMDHINRAYDLLGATAGETLVWHRMWKNDDAYLWRHIEPQAYINHITNGGNISKQLWLYVLNEPDTTPHDLPLLVRWLCEVGDILADRGYHAIMGNIGPATVLPETITSGVFDPYLRKLAEWSAAGQHYAGWHEYTGVMLPFGVGYWPIETLLDPEKVQLENWPEITPLQIQFMITRELIKKYDMFNVRDYTDLSTVNPEPDHYWHLLRTEWFQTRAEAIGAGRFRSVITEFGVDRMPDLSAAMPNIFQQLEAKYGASRGSELKGWRTYEKVYAAYWPEWSFERAIFEQLKWATRNYPDDYIGFNIFAWVFDAHITDKAQRWEPSFNVGDLFELQARLLSAQDEPPGPSPDPPDLPDPEPDTPPAPGWLLPLFVGVIGVIIGAIVYSFIQPRLVAMEVSSMEEFINSLYAIPALVPIAFTMPIVLYLTEALKRLRVKYLPAVEWLSPYVIAMFLVFFCLGSYTVAQTYAYDNVFKDVAKVIVQLIDVFGPYLLTALLGQVAVAAAHKRVRSIGVPGFDQ